MHALRSAGNSRQVGPYLVGAKAQDRRHQARQGLTDAPQRRLGRAPAARAGRRGVEAIFEDVKIHIAQIYSAELIQLMIDAMKAELLIPPLHPLADLGSA